ncbi:hypothetical protein ACMGD3_10320 [Lysinibacillus sphaericus]
MKENKVIVHTTAIGGRFPGARTEPLFSLSSVQGLGSLFPLKSPSYAPAKNVRVFIEKLFMK